MIIARDSGRIADSYAVNEPCPWCKVNKQRFDLEFQVMTVENGQPVESTETVKDICAHCLTVCSQLPRIDFICAKCGQLTLSMETDHSDWPQFTKIFSRNPKFQEFYVSLLKAGAEEGKRYCLHCLNGLWQRYLANPDVLKKELDAPKPDFSLKKKRT